MKLLIIAIILAAPAVQAQDETQQIENAFQMAWCAGYLAAIGSPDTGRGYTIAAGKLAESLVTVDTDKLVELLLQRIISGKEWVQTYGVHISTDELVGKGRPCIDINPLVVELITAWRVAGVTK